MEPAELVKVIKSAKYRQDVILSMPKFKIEYHFRSVQSCMKELGVEKIFVPCGADYGNLFTSVRLESGLESPEESDSVKFPMRILVVLH